ncbi:MAG: acetyl-CoA carboxylase biotin carboxyl carrier protein [Candidatus Omnitrophota bacterium]
MNIKKIEEVIGLMERYNLTEISIEDEGAKIHLRKGQDGQIGKALHVPSPVLTPATQVAPVQVKEEKTNIVEIKAPMVGTLYLSPSPDAKPFVDIGSVIKEGQILCVIEAMKLMNEIKSDVSGKIVDIVVENAEPIEFGQVLFLVEPS